VAARTTSFAHRAASVDIREIGNQIGVDSVLEGSVRKAGNRLRITAQLIDVSNGYHIWSERWDRDLADVFAIQDEIAHATVSALRVRLTERDQRDRDQNKGTTNLEAYDLYLRGRALMFHGGKDRLDAQDLLRRATQVDPGFARAHASLAVLSMFLYQFVSPDPRYLDESLEASYRALALDPSLAAAHAARGYALASTQRFEEAEVAFTKSLAINPDLYETAYFLARVRWIQGRKEEAFALFERATELDPGEYQCACLLVNLAIVLNLGADRIEQVSTRALERTDRYIEKHPNDIRAVYLSASPLQALHRMEEATARTERAMAMDPGSSDAFYNGACFFALAGNSGRALDCLEHALDLGFSNRAWVDHDSDLDSLRETDRFKTMMGRLK